MKICPSCGRERSVGSRLCPGKRCWERTPYERLPDVVFTPFEAHARALARRLEGLPSRGHVAFGWRVPSTLYARASDELGFGDRVPIVTALTRSGIRGGVQGILVGAGGIAFRFGAAAAVRVPWSRVRAVVAVEGALSFDADGWTWTLHGLRLDAPAAVADALAALAALEGPPAAEAWTKAAALARADGAPTDALRDARRTLERLRREQLQARPEASALEALDELRAWGEDAVVARVSDAPEAYAHELLARAMLDGPAVRAEARAFAAALHERSAARSDEPARLRRALARALAVVAPATLAAPVAPDAWASATRIVELHDDDRVVAELRRRLGARPTRLADLPEHARRFVLCTSATAAVPTELLRGAPSAELVASGFRFSPGHPAEGQLYALHPLDGRRYLPLAEFHRTLRAERYDELCRFLASLDAFELEVDDHADEDEAPAPTERVAHGSPPPLLEPVWLASEPTWQQLAREVRAGNLARTCFEVAARGDFGVDADAKRRLAADARLFAIDVAAQLAREPEDEIELLATAPMTVTASFVGASVAGGRGAGPEADRRSGSRAAAEFLADCEDLRGAGALDSDDGRRLLERARQRCGLSVEAAQRLVAATVAFHALAEEERALVEDILDLSERRDLASALARVVDRHAHRAGIPPERVATLRQLVGAGELVRAPRREGSP